MKNFLLLLFSVATLTINAAQPTFGPISITPIGGGIVVTNPPGQNGQVIATDGAGHFYYVNNGLNTNGVTSGALTGNVIKPDGSAVTTIAAGVVAASMMANDLDTNVFSAAGILHLLQTITNSAAYQAKIATNTISANQLTNTLSIQADTNIFSAAGIAHLQSLIAGSAATNAIGNLNGIGTNTLFFGTHTRTINGITNGFVQAFNVFDFGASPTNSDNSTAIQNALNAASTNGMSVFLPGATNTYTCTSTINVPDGVTFFGETVPYGGGSGNASQIYNSSSAIIMTFGNGSVIKNILVQGGGVNGTQIGIANRYTTVGISGYQLDGNLIKNLAVGILLSNTWDGYFPNDTVSACQRSVVFSNYANSITFVAGHYGSSGYGTAIGFDVRGDDLHQKSNLSFLGCVMEVSSNAFNLRGGGGGWDNINISGYGEGNTNVIYANGGLNLNIDHFSFVQSGGTATTNIVIRGVNQVAIDHCYFFNSVAFDADSATSGLTFDRNYVESGVTWNNRAATSFVDNNTNAVWTSKTLYGNGSGLTNLTAALLSAYVYATNNSGTTALSLDTGISYYTNLAAANVTLTLTVNSNANYGSCVYWATNTSGADRTLTFPSGTRGPVGSGFPAVITASNNVLTKVVVEHHGAFIVTATPVWYAN